MIKLLLAVTVLTSAFAQYKQDPSKFRKTNVVQARDLQQLVDFAIIESQSVAHPDDKRVVPGPHVAYKDVHGVWGIMHGVLALKRDYLMVRNRQVVRAVDYLKQGASLFGDPVIQAFRDNRGQVVAGRFHPYNNKPAYLEGHRHQFLAIYSTLKPEQNETFVTPSGDKVTVRQIFDRTKKEASLSQPEVTWTIWALSNLVAQWDLDPFESWINGRGESVSLLSLLQKQLHHVATDPRFMKMACGGTHALFALANFRNNFGHLRGKRQDLDISLSKVDRLLEDYRNRIKNTVKADGNIVSLRDSLNGLRAPVHPYAFQKLNESLRVNGHQLEWLITMASDEELTEPWLEKSVMKVAVDVRSILANPLKTLAQKDAEGVGVGDAVPGGGRFFKRLFGAPKPSKRIIPGISSGPFFHALHALTLYQSRLHERGYVSKLFRGLPGS